VDQFSGSVEIRRQAEVEIIGIKQEKFFSTMDRFDETHFSMILKLYKDRYPLLYTENLPEPLPLPLEIRLMIFKIFLRDLRRMLLNIKKVKLLQNLEFPQPTLHFPGIYQFRCGNHKWIVCYDDDEVYCTQNDYTFFFVNRKHSMTTFNR